MPRRDSVMSEFFDSHKHGVNTEHLLLEVCNFVNDQTSNVYKELLLHTLRDIDPNLVRELLDDVRDLDVTLQYYETRLLRYANEIEENTSTNFKTVFTITTTL